MRELYRACVSSLLVRGLFHFSKMTPNEIHAVSGEYDKFYDVPALHPVTQTE